MDMTNPQSTYGVTTDTASPSGDDSLALEEIERVGFTTLANVVSLPLLVRMRDSLDRILMTQTTNFGGEADMASIGDKGTARALLEADPVFLDLLGLPQLEALVETLLGPAALVMQQNGIVMPGGGGDHVQQSWHRDLPYQSWVATKPLAMGALLALDAFTPDNGATMFIPGSHRHSTFPSSSFVDRWQTPALAGAGSIIVFDAMVFHRGGVNRSPQPRRAVNTLFGIPLLGQQITFTAKPGMDAKKRRRLGLDYAPAESADAWRNRRRARLQGIVHE
jgi:ectoine hydroxylase-related dioxygenase (phytanoyl-CoA dioxygenase family)